MGIFILLAILSVLQIHGNAYSIDNGKSETNDVDQENWLEKALPRQGDLFEGDIEMDARLRRTVLGYTDKRSALTSSVYKWPRGVVPYKFEDGLIPMARIRIRQAVREFNKRTCVRFVPFQGQEDYVAFRSEPSRCSSPVGRQGGKQHITLGKGCTRLGTVLHEMMHSLGIVHEQSRADRDKFVHVIYKNIKKEYMHNFEKYSLDETNDLGVPYNYASIMHYRNSAFSKNGEDTLRAVNKPDLIFGQRIMFSEGDVAEINRLYPCDKHEEVYDGLIENLE